MSADEDFPPSLGLQSLLGRLLHGLLPYRLFQLVGAAWSYLMNLWGPSLPSLLQSGWAVHRSVESSELPEVLEALGLGSGPWNELGDCLEELGPWKELDSPAVEAQLELLSSLSGFVSSKQQDSWDSTLEELDSWQKAMDNSNMQALWGSRLSSWEDYGDSISEEDACHKNASTSHIFYCESHKANNESRACEVKHVRDISQLHSTCLGMVSYILNTGSGGVFTWVDQGTEHNIQSKEVFGKISCQSESDIEHIRNKRLWFLQQNQAQNALIPEENQEVIKTDHIQEVAQSHFDTNQFVLPNPSSPNINSDLPVPEWDGSEVCEILYQNNLLSNFNRSQRDFLELPGSNQECSSCDQVSILLQKSDHSGNIQNKYLPSPDQDQGYHSLEEWQCLNIAQQLKKEGVGAFETCKQDHCDLPTECPCPIVTGLSDDQDSDMSSDLEEDFPSPSVPICTNKHIGYILGTIVSSDEEDDMNSSSEDDWGEDDGFDSEGSVSATESDTPAPEEAVLWKSFCTPDPYNPHNFTASLQTGGVGEESSHSVDGQEQSLSDEESWCDSDAVSDSEDDCSADEEENLKLWNAFVKSDDPYNPLYFTASVQTSKKKRQSRDIVSKYSKPPSSTPSNCELTLLSYHSAHNQTSLLKETSKVSIEESANDGCKKVTFHDKVTVYYVCNEEERKGYWEEFARDRCRSQRRVQEIESVIGHCLNYDHRQRIWNRMQEKCSS